VIAGYEVHPAADVFPLLEGKRFDELVENVRVRGLEQPIVLYGGMVLDGRNRLRACDVADVVPRFEEWDGDDPFEYVWSLNGERRDLSNAQRFLCWKLKSERSAAWLREQTRIRDEANAKRSKATGSQPRAEDGTMLGRTGDPTSCGITGGDRGRSGVAAKAEAARVGRGTVERMDRLAAKRPDLAEKVRTGELKGANAEREMRRDEVASKSAALPEGKHRVIYADPPWSYSNSGAIDDSDAYSRVERHYPPMALADICALPIRDIAAEDAVLFLWVTSPLLESAFQVIRAWGFRYKSSFVWDKVKHNFGHYNSVRHEFLLIATRGSGTPEVPKLHDSVQSIPKTGHSAKPEEFRAIIDELYPTGSRLELFRRGEPPEGWKVWGDEAG